MRTLLAAAALFGLAGCGTGVDVQTDYDPQAIPKFAGWKTYAWLPAKEGGDTRASNSLVGNRVKRAVDSVLAARGFTEGANPDFLVGWHLSIEGKMDVNTVNNYYGYGWGRWYGPGYPGYSSTTVREYDEGTLLIDMVDARAKELAWRGQGKGEIKPDLEPAEREQRITMAVSMILETFPPTTPK